MATRTSLVDIIHQQIEKENRYREKELAFQERQKRYKEKEKNHERNII